MSSPASRSLITQPLSFSALPDPPPLVLGGRAGVHDGLCLEVPAFRALHSPRRPRARSAHDGHTEARVCPARREHLLDLTGVEVGAAQLHRPDAGAVLDGQVVDDLPGQRRPPAVPLASSSWWLSRSLVTSVSLETGPAVAVAAQTALGGHGLAVVQNGQADPADRARLIGPQADLAADAGTVSSGRVAAWSARSRCRRRRPIRRGPAPGRGRLPAGRTLLPRRWRGQWRSVRRSAPRSRAPSPSTMSVCSGSSSRMAIRSGNRFLIVSTSLRGSSSAATTQ